MPTRVITNGIEMAYRLEGAAHAPVVVFVNGLGMDMSMWAQQLPAFASAFQVLRYDLRGHGCTSATPGRYSLDLLSRDLLALLDALNIAEAHVIGTSLGAMVGQQFALAFPERILSLTLCATTSTPPVAAWDERLEATRRLGAIPNVEGIVERWFASRFRAERPDVIQRMRDMVLSTTLDGYVGCSAAIRDMDLADAIHRIKVPTLVVAGEDDRATPLAELRFIARTIPGAELILVQQAAHMPTIEQPAVCNAEMLGFLGRVAQARIHRTPEPSDAARV